MLHNHGCYIRTIIGGVLNVEIRYAMSLTNPCVSSGKTSQLSHHLHFQNTTRGPNPPRSSTRAAALSEGHHAPCPTRLWSDGCRTAAPIAPAAPGAGRSFFLRDSQEPTHINGHCDFSILRHLVWAHAHFERIDLLQAHGHSGDAPSHPSSEGARVAPGAPIQ